VVALGDDQPDGAVFEERHSDELADGADRDFDDLGIAPVGVEDVLVARCLRDQAVGMEEVTLKVDDRGVGSGRLLDHRREAVDQRALGDLEIPVIAAFTVPGEHPHVIVGKGVEVAEIVVIMGGRSDCLCSGKLGGQRGERGLPGFFLPLLVEGCLLPFHDDFAVRVAKGRAPGDDHSRLPPLGFVDAALQGCPVHAFGERRSGDRAVKFDEP
jgi:hypothetical protein